MLYMGNEEFWDDKFSSRKNNPLKPERVLMDNIDVFKTGTVLDIACGDGRNSLYLASSKFRVTGIDFSLEGLRRLDVFSKELGLEVTTIQADLSINEALENLGTYDNALICHYRLKKEMLSSLKNNVKKDGILFITGFYEDYLCDDRIKKEDLLYDVDFEVLNDSFDLINKIREKDDRGSFATYIYKRK